MPTNPPLFQNGALIDTRPPELKVLDFKFEEVVASVNPVIWTEKTPTGWRKFPIFNQNGSGSCVAQTQAKELGIMRWLKDGTYVHFSATDIYQRRVNKPGAGMQAADARSLAKAGVTLEVLAPSQNLTDAQMDGVVIEDYKHQVGSVFSVPNYVSLTSGDIETVASVIQTTGKGVMIFIFFEMPEWTDKPTILNPNLQVGSGSALRHAVTAVDFTLYQGKKALIIEDSWGSSYGIAGQRIITEDFFKVRSWYSGYLMNFQFDTVVVKPKHTFNLDLEFGMTSPEVKALQDCLKYETLFPSNIASTGYFGAITKKAVQDFQVKYVIAPPGSAGFGRCGQLTRAKLNSIFST